MRLQPGTLVRFVDALDSDFVWRDDLMGTFAVVVDHDTLFRADGLHHSHVGIAVYLEEGSLEVVS